MMSFEQKSSIQGPHPQSASSTQGAIPTIQVKSAPRAGLGHSFRILFRLMSLPFRAFFFHPVILFPTGLLALLYVVFTIAPIAFNHILTRASTQLTQLVSLAIPSFGPVTYLYCTIFPSSSSCVKTVERPVAAMSKISRPAVASARLAPDIFASVVGLGDPNLALNQAEIRELALAIEQCTELNVSEALASELWKLSKLTKEIKDQVTVINSLGINTFSFVVLQFSRIQDLVVLIQKGKPGYTANTVSNNLDLLFDSLSRDLTRLSIEIEAVLPILSSAAELATEGARQLLKENRKLLKIQESVPLWRKLLEKQSWDAKQLKRDLALTARSVEGLMSTGRRIEDLQSALVAYGKNVEFFNASLSEWHIVDHQQSAEDEVYAMRHIIASFAHAVMSSKSKTGSLTGSLELDM